MRSNAAVLLLLVGVATAKTINFTVGYIGEPQENGSFNRQAVSSQPKLYLDEPWVTGSEKYAVAMWDAGCPTMPRLHYLQSELTRDETGQLVSLKQPDAPYAPPGAFKETGDARQYVWALYSDVHQAIKPSTIPGALIAFDIQTLEQSNKLHRAKTIDVQVDLGGEVSCNQDRSASANRIVTQTIITTATGVSPPPDFWSKLESAVEGIYSSAAPTSPSLLGYNISTTPQTSAYVSSGTSRASGAFPTANGTIGITVSANLTISASRTAPAPSSTSHGAAVRWAVKGHLQVLTFAAAILGLKVW